MRVTPLILSPALLFLTACGSKADGSSADGRSPATAAASGELTPFQLEHGIGPVTEPVELGPIDEELAETGEHQFEATCSACHKLDERYVGPPLGDVLTRRTPAYVMNMILNPDTMYTRHPEARALLAQYATQMPNMHLTREQARAIVEYIREEAAEQH